MGICVYCNNIFPDSELTQEHVIPKGIGGNLMPNNPFALNSVCKRCNNVCGTYVDGPYIKSWLTQNMRASTAKDYADISQNPILPLDYMGILDEFRYKEKICELWMGPTGDVIYHFHEPYPELEDVAPMIGIPTYVKRDKIDHGFAFLFVRSNNPIWHPTIIFSFCEQFKNSDKFLGNGSIPSGVGFLEIPDELKELHTILCNMQGREHKATIPINLTYGDRFLFKVALGIGSLLLNDIFKTSDSADLLRKALWTKNIEQRSSLPIHGTGFWRGNLENLKSILNWPNGHLICLIEVDKVLNLFLSFYGQQESVIRISSEPEHWRGLFDEFGIVYVISPGLRKCVGPKDLGDFIAFKTGTGNIDTELIQLYNETQCKRTVPPYDI